MLPAPLQARIDAATEAAFTSLKTWTPEEKAAYCEDAVDHPLFAPVDERSSAPFRTLEYDEFDAPATLALESKEKGNASFRAGAAFYPNALLHYREALKHAEFADGEKGGGGSGGGGCGGGGGSGANLLEPNFVSIVHANIAAIHMARGKFISAVDSCHAALRAWPGNSKAAWRAAKSALTLGRAEAAAALAETGRAAAVAMVSGGDATAEAAAVAPFLPLAAEAAALLARQARLAEATAKELAARSAGLDAVRAMCAARGLRLGPPLFNNMRRTLAAPFVAPGDVVHWPVVVLYPEVGHSDYVEAWCEEDTLGELVDTVLPPRAPPPPWDAGRAYAAPAVDIFFKTHPCKPIPVGAAWTPASAEREPEEDLANDLRWVLCPKDAPLLAPLYHPGYVVADLPVFYVVPRGCAFWKEMLRAAGGTFARLPAPGEE
jgi:hypothetical protein